MADTFDVLADQARQHGLVILAGAGVSMPPPSCLPGWRDFNDAVLRGLATRVDTMSGGELPAAETMRGLTTLRDSIGALPIDFQAQLMEEECGPDYFRVLQTIDTEVTNRCHTAIAALAGSGLVRAIVTTNFDRLIERALDARHVAYRVFSHPTDFDALDQALSSDTSLPLIKVHGSVESPDSMVDTLRQRLLGRPESLVRALETLFARHVLLTTGFSGADLSYDEGYLGLRAGTARSPLVVVLTRAGSEPLPALKALVDRTPAATMVPGRLPDALVAVCASAGLDVPAPSDDGDHRAERLAQLNAGVLQWVDTLGDLSATNILGAVVEGVSTRAAFIVLTSASTVARTTDRSTDGYWRYQVNLGRQLLERGIAGQDLPTRETVDAIASGSMDNEELDDAFSILTRAGMRAGRLDALPLLARVHAYRGEYPLAIEMVKRFREAALTAQHGLGILEAFIAAATVHQLAGNWSGGLEWLETIHPRLRQFGDEPRRARLAARLGRFLAWAERYDEAERQLEEGLQIAAQLKLGLVEAELRAAYGYLELDRGRPNFAVAHLLPAAQAFKRAELLSPLLPVLLDLGEAAFLVDQNELSIAVLGDVEQELDRYPGLTGHYQFKLATLLTRGGKPDEARTMLAKARAVGTQQGNGWLVKASTTLEDSIRGR